MRMQAKVFFYVLVNIRETGIKQQHCGGIGVVVL